MEEAKALSNEDFVKALQTIGIDIESEQGLLSSSSIGTSFASFRDSHTESIAAEETKAVEQKKEPIEQPSSQEITGGGTEINVAEETKSANEPTEQPSSQEITEEKTEINAAEETKSVEEPTEQPSSQEITEEKLKSTWLKKPNLPKSQ